MPKIKSFIKKHWPVLTLCFVWFIFAYKYFLKGLVPFPSTFLVQFFPPWNNFFGMPVKNNAMPDVITQIYVWKKITIEAFRQGQIPWWNPYQFAGTPHLANVQSAVFTPFNLLFFLLPFLDAWSILILLQPLLAALFTYLFVRRQKVSATGAVIAAIAFMFCGFMTTWMAYGTLGYAILYLPLVLFLIDHFYEKNDWKNGLGLSLALTFSIFSGHFQTSLYLLIAAALFTLFRFLQQRSLKKLLWSGFYFFLGLVFSAVQLVPAFSFYTQSVRSATFGKMEVIPWNYLITALAPDFFGNPVTRNDWFGHYAEWASFVGVVPLLLAFYLVLKRRRPGVVHFFFGLAIFSLLLAFPTPFLDFLVSLKVPVLSTSAASRIVVLFSFAVAVLSGFGFDFLRFNWQKSEQRRKSLFYFGFWVLLVIGVWVLLFSGNLLFTADVNAVKLAVAKRNFVLPSLTVFGIFILVFGGFLKNKLWLTKYLLPAFLVGATIFELLRFAGKWMPFESRQFVYPEIPVLTHLVKNAGFERVFGNFGNEAQAYFGLYGIEGYDPLYIRRYGEFSTTVNNGKITLPTRSVVRFDKNGDFSKLYFDLLSVKFFLHSKGDGRNIWAFPYWQYGESFGGAVYSDEKYEIYENVNIFPRTFLVYNYEVKTGDQAIIDTMLVLKRELLNTVVLEEKPFLNGQELLSGQCTKEQQENKKVAISKYTPNEVVLEVNSDCPGLVFLSDSYYPAWQAYVNGQKAPIYRANYTFRAVPVGPGRSLLKFVYENWYL